HRRGADRQALECDLLPIDPSRELDVVVAHLGSRVLDEAVDDRDLEILRVGLRDGPRDPAADREEAVRAPDLVVEGREYRQRDATAVDREVERPRRPLLDVPG